MPPVHRCAWQSPSCFAPLPPSCGGVGSSLAVLTPGCSHASPARPPHPPHQALGACRAFAPRCPRSLPHPLASPLIAAGHPADLAQARGTAHARCNWLHLCSTRQVAGDKGGPLQEGRRLRRSSAYEYVCHVLSGARVRRVQCIWSEGRGGGQSSRAGRGVGSPPEWRQGGSWGGRNQWVSQAPLVAGRGASPWSVVQEARGCRAPRRAARQAAAAVQGGSGRACLRVKRPSRARRRARAQGLAGARAGKGGQRAAANQRTQVSALRSLPCGGGASGTAGGGGWCKGKCGRGRRGAGGQQPQEAQHSLLAGVACVMLWGAPWRGARWEAAGTAEGRGVSTPTGRGQRGQGAAPRPGGGGPLRKGRSGRGRGGACAPVPRV